MLFFLYVQVIGVCSSYLPSLPTFLTLGEDYRSIAGFRIKGLGDWWTLDRAGVCMLSALISKPSSLCTGTAVASVAESHT